MVKRTKPENLLQAIRELREGASVKEEIAIDSTKAKKEKKA